MTESYAVVVPDVPAVNKQFVYSIPEKFSGRIEIGTQVRIDMQGRRVAGWVTDITDEAPIGVKILPIVAVRGIGPPSAVVDLASWSAWRWAGALAFGLRTASSEKVVAGLPKPRLLGAVPPRESRTLPFALEGVTVARVGPSGDRLGILVSASNALWNQTRGPGSGVLVLAPTHAQADEAARRLRNLGYPVALLPGDWPLARAGDCVVVGTMAGAFAPLERICAAVVLDAHDEAYHAEAAPTWCAWEVVVERARRDGAPVALVSPCPTLDVLAVGPLSVPERSEERRAWPLVEVVDRRDDDPRTGLFSERVVRMVRWAAEDGEQRRVICVLNRKGRARLLACARCKSVARCERCGGAVSQENNDLVCSRCGLERPMVCAECGATRLSILKAGVSKVREDLEALAGTQVYEVSGANTPNEAIPEDARVLVGTEAVLHRLERADAVMFLDFDSELMAPRLRAGEEALALIVRAARLVSRSHRSSPPGAPLVVQTRMPEHPAIQGAVRADPAVLEESESEVRTALRLPPVTALARISGASAEVYVTSLEASIASGSLFASGVEVHGPHEGEWRVVAENHQKLCDLFASVARPGGRLRVEVDPVRA